MHTYPVTLALWYSQALAWVLRLHYCLQGLDLRGNFLNGTIPTAVMGMPWMTWLYLGANPSLAGTLPPMALYNLEVRAWLSCTAALHCACTCLASDLPLSRRAQYSAAMLRCTSHSFKLRLPLQGEASNSAGLVCQALCVAKLLWTAAEGVEDLPGCPGNDKDIRYF